MKKHSKPYPLMNAKELAAATAQFDRECVIDQSREQTPEERRQWRKAKQKRGRPKQGRGVQIISVSIEKGLLKKTDRLAKKLRTQRTKLIARGLEAVLSEEAAIK
jgi:predicted transcriptional regulator